MIFHIALQAMVAILVHHTQPPFLLPARAPSSSSSLRPLLVRSSSSLPSLVARSPCPLSLKGSRNVLQCRWEGREREYGGLRLGD